MQVRVSKEINGLLDAAGEISKRYRHYFVGVEHLFEAILEAATYLPQEFVERYSRELHMVARELAQDGWKGGPASDGEVFYTPRCGDAVSSAARYAEYYRVPTPNTGHLLLAILADANAAPSRILDRLQAPRGEMIAFLRSALASKGTAKAPARPVSPTAAQPEPTPVQAAEETRPAAEGPILETLTRDLSALAQEGKLEAAIGRDAEMFQVLQVLARKNKNNVMLVGEAGVGKTQIVEGLAVAAQRDGMDGLLRGCRFLELNIGALMGGTQYRGALEQKISALLAELSRAKNAILFIDEAHLIMGAGATEGDSIDVANLLKPALARGEFRCIGATTLQEYRKFVEKDPAIERRFQMVRVDPLSEDATREVLANLRPSLEKHHGVRISRRALEAAILLSQRYMPNRHLPDKAIDVIDQACARYRLQRAAALSAAARTSSAGGAQRTVMIEQPSKVMPQDVRSVISQNTGIPVEEMTAQERLMLTDLDRILKARIIGQDQAVDRAVAAVKKARVGLAAPNRPDAVMLFIGPTGVGKTQLARSLAENLFGSTSHLVTFDMSDYTEAHSVSRLVGAPPGYAGCDEEGALFRAMRSTPFAILLFDEIEKAHPRIFDTFLPIFEDGRLKDSRGREVSFRETIIIMTSNVGADLLRRDDPVDEQRELMDMLRGHFRPELINRIDQIVPFYPLLFEDIRSILNVLLSEFGHRLRERKIGVRVFQGAYEHLAEQGYSVEFGARELRRTVERLVVEPISDLMLRSKLSAGDTVEVLMEDGVLAYRRAAARQEASV